MIGWAQLGSSLGNMSVAGNIKDAVMVHSAIVKSCFSSHSGLTHFLTFSFTDLQSLGLLVNGLYPQTMSLIILVIVGQAECGWVLLLS